MAKKKGPTKKWTKRVQEGLDRNFDKDSETPKTPPPPKPNPPKKKGKNE